MLSANLISLGGLIVAIVAFVVSYYTYRVQKRAQVSAEEQARTAEEQNRNDLRQKMNDLIEKIESNLATVAQPQTSFNVETFAAQNSALAVMQGQALAARRLARENKFQLDWFQNMVLAYAFTQTWDPAGAIDFWTGAVEGATDLQARIRSRTARAEFYYVRGNNDDVHNDWQHARADYQAALDELRQNSDGQGPDLVANQAAGMAIYQAGLEYSTGNDAMAISLVVAAFVDANSIRAPGRKRDALVRLGSLVQVMENKMALPPDALSAVAAELSRLRVDPESLPAAIQGLLSMPPDGSQESKGQLFGERL